MLEARSMYFGGEIIGADECDYQTSRELGLICPFCNSAVFIRSESVRQTKNKLQLVRPYFAHYPTGTDNSADCEKRARSKQGREKIEAIKIQAKNQRLRLYNAHLWDMIATDRNISQQSLNRIRSIFGERWCEERSILVRHEFKNSLDSVYTLIDAAIEGMQQPDFLMAPGGRPMSMSAKDWIEECEKQNAYILGCDRRLHRAVCFEIADFLSTNTAGFAFVKIFKACLKLHLGFSSPSEIKQDSARMYVSSIAGFIAGTHWAEQINKRLSEEN